MTASGDSVESDIGRTGGLTTRGRGGGGGEGGGGGRSSSIMEDMTEEEQTLEAGLRRWVVPRDVGM